MLLDIGENIHVITRRCFEDDLRRHFVGEVKTISETAVRAEGYVFVFNTVKNEYIRRDAVRTRIISIVDGGNIINVLPQGILLKNLRYRQSKENRLILTDDASFELDINEFGANC